MQENKAQDRPGWSRWLLVLGVVVVFVSLGFAVVLLRGVNQPEATPLGGVGTSTLLAIPSPTLEEAPAKVLDTPTPIPSPTVEEAPATVLNTPTPTGPLAPDFTLPDLDGKMWSLSQFRGRPVVLFFWATW